MDLCKSAQGDFNNLRRQRLQRKNITQLLPSKGHRGGAFEFMCVHISVEPPHGEADVTTGSTSKIQTF